MDEHQLNALKLLDEILQAHNYNYFFIGASARDLLLDHQYKQIGDARRATDDFDIALEISTIQAYTAIMNQLLDIGFEKDSQQSQRVHLGNIQFDIVPFGGLESPKGTVNMAEGWELSTIGMEEVQRHLETIQVEHLNLRVPSLAGLVILKLIAWNDRRTVRQKDVLDILFIFNHIYDWDLDLEVPHLLEKYPEVTEWKDFTTQKAGAYYLGREIAVILQASPATLKVIRQIVETELDRAESSELFNQSITRTNTLDAIFDLYTVFAKALHEPN